MTVMINDGYDDDDDDDEDDDEASRPEEQRAPMSGETCDAMDYDDRALPFRYRGRRHMRTPLRTFLLLLLLQAVPGRMLLSLIATSVPKGHRRHPVQRPFEPTLLATDCAVNRRTHKLPLNRTLMTSKAAPVTHVAPVQTATPRLRPMTRTCLALCPWNWLVPLWTGPRFFSEICIDESLMLPSLGLRPGRSGRGLDGPSETWPSAIGHRHRGQRLGCSPARDYKTGLPLSTRRDMPPDPSKLAERGTLCSTLLGVLSTSSLPCRPVPKASRQYTY